MDLVAVAEEYMARWRPRVAPSAPPVRRLARTRVRLDERLCRDIADHFARQPLVRWDGEVARRYALLRAEIRRQYQAIVDAGIRILPWRGIGQPYSGSAELCEQVRTTGTLYVYLTRNGHGPPGGTRRHPLREPSGLSADGVELTHNDLLRAVHDVFGHVMLGNSMGPAGEFKAAHCHMTMCSEDAHPALFAEQISQVCWFFFGPHLRRSDGTLPHRGEPGWVSPARRPYAEQKVFAAPRELVERFTASFYEECG